MMAMARDMERQIKRDGSIDFKYERPKGQFTPLIGSEISESIEADRKWQASENGKKAAAEKEKVAKEFHEAMHNALRTSGVP